MIKINKLLKICIFAPTINTFGLYCYIEAKSNSEKFLNSQKLNIVFDLDETLIHTDKITNYSNSNKSNMLVPEHYIINTNRKIWIRQGVNTLLPILARFNNLYLFTKATEPYTLDILNQTKLNKYFKDKKFRPDCKDTCKDLNKFGIDGYALLIDDKKSNQCGGQNFYHVPKFNSWTKYDFEFIKLFGWIIWLNILNDLNQLK